MLFRADGSSRIYRRQKEPYACNCVLEQDRVGGGSVIVMGTNSPLYLDLPG